MEEAIENRWEFLNSEENRKVGQIMQKYEIAGFSAYVQFYGRGEPLQIDGDVPIKELKCLLKIAEYLDCP